MDRTGSRSVIRRAHFAVRCFYRGGRGRLLRDVDRASRRLSAGDAQIAAAAIQHDLTLVTRNVKDFQNFDIRLLGP